MKKGTEMTDKAIEAAARALHTDLFGPCWEKEDEKIKAGMRKAVRPILEAYEKALWRPISEFDHKPGFYEVYRPGAGVFPAEYSVDKIDDEFCGWTAGGNWTDGLGIYGIEITHYRPLPPGPEEGV